MRKICPFTVPRHSSWLASEHGWPQPLMRVGWAQPLMRVFHAPAAAVVDPSQLMMHPKDLPAAEFVDHTFVFH